MIVNISDITFRAVEVLKNADIIACEDTRVSKKLFSLLTIPTNQKKFITLNDINEEESSQKIINLANEGHIVAYISDAGSPLISDPGYKLAKKCRLQNTFITTIPGACAAICALQLSGLPSNSFTFAGFIPNKEKARNDFLQKYQSSDSTTIFYETANRLIKTLSAISTVFGNREIAVAREITKLFEDVQNGTAEQLIKHFTENPPKGEIVLLIAPSNEKPQIDLRKIILQELKKSTLKTAVTEITKKYNLNKNEVYQAALELKNEQ